MFFLGLIVSLLTLSAPHAAPTLEHRASPVHAFHRFPVDGGPERSAASAPGLRGQHSASASSVPDGAGGQYVIWTESRDGNGDLFLLRVTNSGAPANGWPVNGLVVCDARGWQGGAALFPDGSGGVLMEWRDGRDDLYALDRYAQRVSGSGVPQWTANGVQLLDGTLETWSVTSASDGTGGILLAWSVGFPPDMDVYALRVDNTGALASGWNASGTLVCDSLAFPGYVAVTHDGAGGAIVAWTDIRNGGPSELFLQRMDAIGAAQWTANGISAGTSVGGTYEVVLQALGGGHVIAGWIDFGGGVLGQRFDGSGNKQWNGGTPVTIHPAGSVATPSNLRSALDGTGGVLIGWESQNLGTHGLQSQRVSGTGTLPWGADGVSLVSISNVFPSQLDMTSDGAGGGLYAWSDGRNGLELDMFVQHVTAAGTTWAANGVAASTFARQQNLPFVAPDGAGGLLVSWIDNRSEDVEIYTQRFNAAGTAQLATNGTPTFVNPGQQYAAGIVQTADGGALVVFNEKRGGQYDIRARKLNPDGTPAAGATLITDAPGGQLLRRVVDDGAGGAIALWADPAQDKIFAQRINGTATPVWAAGGIEVAPGAVINDEILLIPDGAGGAIFTWPDFRSGTDPDVYAQRIDAAGTRVWGAGGVGVCTTSDRQESPVLTPDGLGGAFFAWPDDRDSLLAIYAQRLDAAGTRQWATDGVQIASYAFPTFSVFLTAATASASSQAIFVITANTFDLAISQNKYVLRAQKVDGSGVAQWGAQGGLVADTGGLTVGEGVVDDGAGGAYFSWNDTRNGPPDIFAQHLDSDANATWTANGQAVCTASGWQTLGGVTRIAGGDLVLTWSDERAGQPDIYAQRMSPAGSPVFAANGIDLTPVARGQFAPVLAPWKTAAPERLYLAWTDNRAGDTRYAYAQRFDLNLAAQWTSDGVTDIAMSLVSATAEAGRVRLAWSVPAGASATVYRRADDDAVWASIGRETSDGSGRIAFDDRDVTAGTRYGYRIGVMKNGAETFSAEAWVDVPVAVFALDRVAVVDGSRASVTFTLPRAGSASLELVDISGRRIGSREFEGLGAGTHTAEFEGPRASGVYFVRLRQGTASVTRRVALVR